MTIEFVEPACKQDGTFVPIDSRRHIISADVCAYCFANAEHVSDIPEEWDLCRTYSKGALTVHRTLECAGERLRYNTERHTLEDNPDGEVQYEKLSSKLERMSIEEFEQQIGGGA